MTVGNELERARTSQGLSLEDLSARTKVSVERLTAIEGEDVEYLPPIVYLRGFLRSYATEVGLNPDEVVGRYLAQLAETAHLEEEPAIEKLVPARQAEVPAIRTEMVALDEELSAIESFESEVEPQPLAEPWKTSDGTETHSIDRSSDPHSTVPVLWRPAQFADQHPEADTERSLRHVNTEPDSVAPTPPAANKSRLPLMVIATVIAVVAGYFLSANLDTLRGAGSSTAQNPAPNAADQARVEKTSDEVATAGSSPSDASQKTSGVSPARADAHEERAVPADARETADVEDLNGSWTLTNRVEEASYAPFKNLTLSYSLQLEQDGNRITGTGHKLTENGRQIRANGRTPIALAGTLTGRRLELKFAEVGARRPSGGTMVLDVADDGSLRGSFTSDAARSRGSSQARRVP